MRVIMISVFLASLMFSAWTDRAIVARAEQIKQQPAWGQLVSVNQDLNRK
ncbi:MAG: hypothetical protein JO205_05410 [Pseudolabrys sp.]|nr:hypothetical protein [Pseudolabrys sp.]